MQEWVGQKLGGRYRLEALLDSGGMGSVFRATDERGAAVAVKLLHPRFSSEARHLARFRREASVLSRLAHPHIVQVIDAVEASGDEPAFLVMELLRGTSLARRVKTEGALTADDAILVTRQILGALSAVHALGALHRDLKPGNVFWLEASGMPHVKVIDFGLAMLMDTEAYERLTMTGQILGTPAYMSPEQALGEPLDERTDVYAVGAILYTALSGAPPYLGGLDGAIPKLLAGDRPRIDALVRGIDPRLADVVEKAMARAPDERFVSADDFDQALSAFDAREIPTLVGWKPEVPLETLRTELHESPPAPVRPPAPPAKPTARAKQAAASPHAPAPAPVPVPVPARRRAWPWVLGLVFLATGVSIAAVTLLASPPASPYVGIAPTEPVILEAPASNMPSDLLPLAPSERDAAVAPEADPPARPPIAAPTAPPTPVAAPTAAPTPARRPRPHAEEVPAPDPDLEGPRERTPPPSSGRMRLRDMTVFTHAGLPETLIRAEVRRRLAGVEPCVSANAQGAAVVSYSFYVYTGPGGSVVRFIETSNPELITQCFRGRVNRRWPAGANHPDVITVTVNYAAPGF